jgi:hypothetical protein
MAIKRVTLELDHMTIVVWPELERVAVLSPLGECANVSIEECLDALKSIREERGGKQTADSDRRG